MSTELALSTKKTCDRYKVWYICLNCGYGFSQRIENGVLAANVTVCPYCHCETARKDSWRSRGSLMHVQYCRVKGD